MPWYKSGTVSVTQNSNAVIGAGTAFIANSRVGDAFRGPDGGWYEVTNIVSDTAMSISPNYQGATNAAGIYALAPMQGYVKDSADALRALVNLYGAKLAALGTTGNYDILPANKGGTGISDLSGFIQGMLNDADAPAARTTLGAAKSGANDDITALSGLTTALSVAQGGTGGSNQISARAGLGLGNAATATIGMAAGNVMQVGAFGLGTSFNLPASTDMNNGPAVYASGFYKYSAAAVGRPDFGSGYGSFLQFSTVSDAGGGYGGQFAIDYIQAEAGFRSLRGGAGFSAWCKFYHTGNTTRAADGTLKAI